MDCEHFSTQREAQATLDYWKARGHGDVHRLDADNDGVECESRFG